MNGPVQNEQLNTPAALDNAAQHHKPDITGVPENSATITPEHHAEIDEELAGIGVKLEGEHALAAELPNQKEEPEASLNHGLDPNDLKFDDTPRLLHVIETGKQKLIKDALSEKDKNNKTDDLRPDQTEASLNHGLDPNASELLDTKSVPVEKAELDKEELPHAA